VVVVVVVMMAGVQHSANYTRNGVMVVVMMVMILSGLNSPGTRLIGEPRIISL
jgi:hypothetical protein